MSHSVGVSQRRMGFWIRENIGVQLLIVAVFSLGTIVSHPSLWYAVLAPASAIGAVVVFRSLRRSQAKAERIANLEDILQIRAELRDLLARLQDRLIGIEMQLVPESVEISELRMALGAAIEQLAETRQPVTERERADLLALGVRLDIGDRVRTCLSLCPASR